MKTIEQKRAVIDEYNKSTKELLPRMMAAIASRRKDKMEEIYKEHVSLCLPVMQTYSDAIVDAVNPINERTAFIVIAALEVITDRIKRVCKVDDERVKMLLESIGHEETIVEFPHSLWKTM